MITVRIFRTFLTINFVKTFEIILFHLTAMLVFRDLKVCNIEIKEKSKKYTFPFPLVTPT